MLPNLHSWKVHQFNLAQTFSALLALRLLSVFWEHGLGWLLQAELLGGLKVSKPLFVLALGCSRVSLQAALVIRGC